MCRHVVWAICAVLLGAAVCAACGDDTSNDESPQAADGGARDAGPSKTSAGHGGTRARGVAGGAGGAGAGGAGAAGYEAPSLPPLTVVRCGTAVCGATSGRVGGVCCADEVSGTCGTTLATGECTAPAASVVGCPALNLAGILRLPSCCTSRGMCGVELTGVGVPGCMDLATAAERARMSGASVVFPAPRACGDADASVGADAGVEADAGDEDAGR